MKWPLRTMLLLCMCIVSLLSAQRNSIVTHQDPNADLFEAIFDNNYEIILKSLQQGANLQANYIYERYAKECRYWQPIHAAAAIGNIKVLKLLHSKGADLKAALPVQSKRQHLLQPIHIAASYGNTEAVAYLLEQGVNPNALDSEEKSPLVYAVSSTHRDNLDIVKMLIDKGAIASINYEQGKSPLFDACQLGKYKVAELLLNKGVSANINSKAYAPYLVSPIFVAIATQKNKLLPLLFDHGALINAIEWRSTPLHWAVEHNNLEAAVFLVKKGGSRTQKDANGKTALDLAIEKRMDSFIALLETGHLPEKDRRLLELFNKEEFKQFNTQSKSAPSFAFSDLSGNSISLDSLAGKVVILNVWATWCEPCLREQPHFKKLIQKINHKDLIFLAVSIDQKMETLKRYALQHSFPFLYLHDPNGLSRTLFAEVVPSTYVIDKKGSIKAMITGSIDWDKKEYEELLKILLEQ